MQFVKQYLHLRHILSHDFDDAFNINRGPVKLISQINSILCYFRKVSCFVWMRLLTTYCYSSYGCVLWDFVHPIRVEFLLRGQLVLGVHGICITEHTVTCFL